MKHTYALLVALLLAMVYSCSEPMSTPNPTTITLTPELLTLQVGESKQLTLTCTPERKDYVVSYQSSNPAVSVDADGRVVGVSVGEAIVTAQVGDKTASSRVVVQTGSTPAHTSLSLKTDQLELFVGHSAQIEYTVTPEDALVTFSSDEADIATVSDKGLVTARSKGNCRIAVKSADTTAYVSVSVHEEGIAREQEMPLMKFQVEQDASGKVTDAEVLAYEAALGRKMQSIQYDDEHTLRAFVNKELNVITTAVYGIDAIDGGRLIYAYGKESTTYCPVTKEMLALLGFTEFTTHTINGYPNPALRSINDQDPTLSVLLLDEERPDLNATMYIEFAKDDYSKRLNPKHPIVPESRDFPAVSEFNSHDEELIKSAEEKIGYRNFDKSQSKNGNLDFEHKPDKIAQTNFEWVYYVNNAPSGYPYINTQLFCIRNQKDIESAAMKQWFSNNGFNQNYTITETGAARAYNASGDLCQAFIEIYDNKPFAKLQIILQKDIPAGMSASMRPLSKRIPARR